jgi:hypothetical protein
VFTFTYHDCSNRSSSTVLTIYYLGKFHAGLSIIKFLALHYEIFIVCKYRNFIHLDDTPRGCSEWWF